VKAVFSSFRFEQQKERAILTADIPLGFIKKIFNEPPPQVGPQEDKPAVAAPEVPKQKASKPKK
jgi:hypothetical protein